MIFSIVFWLFVLLATVCGVIAIGLLEIAKERSASWWPTLGDRWRDFSNEVRDEINLWKNLGWRKRAAETWTVIAGVVVFIGVFVLVFISGVFGAIR